MKVQSEHPTSYTLTCAFVIILCRLLNGHVGEVHESVVNVLYVTAVPRIREPRKASPVLICPTDTDTDNYSISNKYIDLTNMT